MSEFDHPPEPPRAQRRRTHESSHSSESSSWKSLNRRWTANQDGSKTDRKGKPVQERFSAYEDLQWGKLEAYLKGKWPNWTFNPVKKRDYWVFEAPEPLTKEDRDNIAALRDSNQPTRRASVSDSE
ncbi:Fc.00g024510.m01.CDS01 [Cosmosporella sp. VM-42]